MNKFKRKTKKENLPAIVNKDHQRLKQLTMNILKSRIISAEKLGYQYGTKRDIYTALGYPKEPDFEEYWGWYLRGDISSQIVNAAPDACWQDHPEVTENENDETVFESEWKKLVKARKVFHYLLRLDQVSGIGQYGVLLLGFDDSENLSELLGKGKAKELLYLCPYMERDVSVVSWVEDDKDPRFGLPNTYSIETAVAGTTRTRRVLAHYSRIIHASDNLINNSIFGRPRLEKVLNRLYDISKVAGCSGEGFWRGAFPGYAFKMQEDAELDDSDIETLEDEIDKFIHGFQRYMKIQGMDIDQFMQQIADPTGCISVYLDLIAGTTGIPKRILIGSERGELASSQDETAWNKRMSKRQLNYCEPFILRPFIDVCIFAGVLPEPAEEYEIKWKNMFEPTEQEKANVASTKTASLATYAASQGADMIVPPRIFLKEVMGFSDELIEQIEGELSTMVVDDDEEEDEKEIEEEEIKNNLTLHGGEGSGNFDHAGSPGEVGGGAPSDGVKEEDNQSQSKSKPFEIKSKVQNPLTKKTMKLAQKMEESLPEEIRDILSEQKITVSDNVSPEGVQAKFSAIHDEHDRGYITIWPRIGKGEAGRYLLESSLYHEVGHAVDRRLGGVIQKGRWISDNETFKKAFLEDRVKIKPKNTELLSHHISSSQEIFAATFAHVYGKKSVLTPKEFEASFPNTIKALKDIIGEYSKKVKK